MFFCPVPINSDDIIELPIKPSSKPSKPMLRNYQRFRYDFKRDIAFKHSVMGLCKTHLSNNGAYDLVVLTLVSEGEVKKISSRITHIFFILN